MSNKVSIHRLAEGLEQHKGLLQSFAKRLAVGGDMEEAQQSLDLFNDENQQKNSKARDEMMELAKTAEDLQAYFKEYEGVDAGDSHELEDLMTRVNGNHRAESEARPVQENIAGILGVSLSGSTRNDEEEDDLEVTIVQKDDPRRLKCPLTGSLIEDPVKNKVCGHSYSKGAIIEHLRISRQKECPVAGCNTIHIQLDQLADNIELSQDVRRHKRRLDKEKERVGLDSDDEGE